MKQKFIKKQCLLNVILGVESEMFELVGPNGVPLLITDDYKEMLDFLRSKPTDAKIVDKD